MSEREWVRRNWWHWTWLSWPVSQRLQDWLASQRLPEAVANRGHKIHHLKNRDQGWRVGLVTMWNCPMVIVDEYHQWLMLYCYMIIISLSYWYLIIVWYYVKFLVYSNACYYWQRCVLLGIQFPMFLCRLFFVSSAVQRPFSNLQIFQIHLASRPWLWYQVHHNFSYPPLIESCRL